MLYARVSNKDQEREGFSIPQLKLLRQYAREQRLTIVREFVDVETAKQSGRGAEQGHWPSRAPVGYLDNLATHRIEVDPARSALIAKVFEWYASGECSLNALTAKAHAVGLTHPRSGRRMMNAEIHRILQSPIYTGDFRWQGRLSTARMNR